MQNKFKISLITSALIALSGLAVSSYAGEIQVNSLSSGQNSIEFSFSADSLSSCLVYPTAKSKVGRSCVKKEDTKTGKYNYVFSFGKGQIGKSGAVLSVKPAGEDSHIYPEVTINQSKVHWVDGNGQNITITGDNIIKDIDENAFVNDFHSAGSDNAYMQLGDGRLVINNSNGTTTMQNIPGDQGLTFKNSDDHHNIVLNLDEDYRYGTDSSEPIPLDNMKDELVVYSHGNSVDLKGTTAAGTFNMDTSSAGIDACHTDGTNYDQSEANCLAIDDNLNLVWHKPSVVAKDTDASGLIRLTKVNFTVSTLPSPYKWAINPNKSLALPVLINDDVRAYSLPELMERMRSHQVKGVSFMPRLNVIPMAANGDIATAIQKYFSTYQNNIGSKVSLLRHYFDFQGATDSNISLQFHADGETYSNKYDADLNPFAGASPIHLPSVVYVPASVNNYPADTSSEHGYGAFWYNWNNAGSSNGNNKTVNVDGQQISIDANNQLTGTLTKPGLYEVNLEAYDKATGHAAWRAIYIDVSPNSASDFGGSQAILQDRFGGRNWMWTYN